MNYKMMGRFLAQILSLEGVLMLPAVGISLYCGETMAVRGFLIAIFSDLADCIRRLFRIIASAGKRSLHATVQPSYNFFRLGRISTNKVQKS